MKKKVENGYRNRLVFHQFKKIELCFARCKFGDFLGFSKLILGSAVYIIQSTPSKNDG